MWLDVRILKQKNRLPNRKSGPVISGTRTPLVFMLLVLENSNGTCRIKISFQITLFVVC